MAYKTSRLAAIHDLSGFGRCSLTVIIPILSAMGIQVCPLPTAVLSTHTGGFDDYHFVDLTHSMQANIDHWQSLNIQFDSIYSGFLGSIAQIDIVKGFIERLRINQHTLPLVLIDPVFADDGALYTTFTHEMVTAMKYLVQVADVITPNITEAAFLLGQPYPLSISMKQCKQWLRALTDLGPKTAIITSVPLDHADGTMTVMAYDRVLDSYYKVSSVYIPEQYPGTGDIFASVLIGTLLNGEKLPTAMSRAVDFVSVAIRTTYELHSPPREGVLLEKVLPQLGCSYITNQFVTI